MDYRMAEHMPVGVKADAELDCRSATGRLCSLRMNFFNVPKSQCPHIEGNKLP